MDTGRTAYKFLHDLVLSARRNRIADNNVNFLRGAQARPGRILSILNCGEVARQDTRSRTNRGPGTGHEWLATGSLTRRGTAVLWEREPDFGAAVRRVAGEDRAPMRGHQVFYDGQAQSGARRGTRLVGTVEATEYMG